MSTETQEKTLLDLLSALADAADVIDSAAYAAGHQQSARTVRARNAASDAFGDAYKALESRLAQASPAGEEDTKRLDWCERHMQSAAVFDPPSGDAWVWTLRYVLAGDPDDGSERFTTGHIHIREAIDDAMTAARHPGERDTDA